MTPEPATPTIAASHQIPWLGLTAVLSGIYCALFTGLMFRVVLRGHNWGCSGRPAWADHAGMLGLAIALVLSLMALGNSFWQVRWAAKVPAMARGRYRTWYAWSALLGIPLGLVFGGLTFWLIRTHHMPLSALGVIFLGTLATVMSSTMIGYYHLQSLTRTQRDLLVQAQLAPHFLFNSLSTLKGQIADEPIEAQATADRLSRLFRDLMDMGSQASVPLSRELAFVEAYLGLEQARLGERLQVHIQVPDELEAFPVPPLSLQVLVENAIRHAIAPRVEGGLLSIRASRIPSGLQLVVGDPGNGQSADPGTGRGLQVLRARLARPSDLRFERLPNGHQATLILRHA